jgi:phage terminase large subunit
MKANPNFIHLKRSVPENRFTLLQGGTRSGKTFSTIYYFIWLCNEYRGLEIDIVRDTFTALKSTVWKDFKQVLVKHNLYDASNHNKTDKIYNLNGNLISYYGADDPAKIHGRARDFLWINECNQLDEETIDQLFPRTRHRIIMDYNPALPTEHWLDKYIEQYPPLITTYKDNPHLTKAQVLEIESKKDNAYWWSVYGTGERTKPTGTIFNNWTDGEFDNSLPYCYGMDFGYVNDPTTLIKVAKDKKNIYVKELCYEKGLSTEAISDLLFSTIDKNDTVIADNAEPRLISELQEKGHRVYPCVKGKDSVMNGITQMQDFKIIVDKNSHNIKKELNNYRFHDKINNKPVDDYNHAIDAIRYAFDELNAAPMYFG